MIKKFLTHFVAHPGDLMFAELRMIPGLRRRRREPERKHMVDLITRALSSCPPRAPADVDERSHVSFPEHLDLTFR